MLCHCVTAANRARYVTQLEEMFRQRYKFFVESLGWRELRRPDGRDFDHYDTDDSVYLMVIGDMGEVFASTRLNPTWGRHQLENGSELRERFAVRTPPVGPTIWEGSRLIGGQPEKHGPQHAQKTMGILLCGVQEFCMRRGITLGTSIFETRTLSRMHSLGWETEPLGLPVTYDTDRGRGEAIAITWKTGGKYLAVTRKGFDVRGPVYFEAAPAMGENETHAPYFPLMELAAEISTSVGQLAAMDAVRSVLEQEAANAHASRAQARRTQ
jgi:acyl-homoserine lactone synthase